MFQPIRGEASAENVLCREMMEGADGGFKRVIEKAGNSSQRSRFQQVKTAGIPLTDEGIRRGVIIPASYSLRNLSWQFLQDLAVAPNCSLTAA